jgi:hypothetical protein
VETWRSVKGWLAAERRFEILITDFIRLKRERRPAGADNGRPLPANLRSKVDAPRSASLAGRCVVAKGRFTPRVEIQTERIKSFLVLFFQKGTASFF